MEITHPPVAFEDDRGRIIDVMEAIDFNYATVISSRKGVTRGNHYHEKTTQWVYVLRGRMMAHSRMPDGELQRAILETGDLIKNPPFEQHALTALADSEFLVLTAGQRGGKDYEKDTYRLTKPMQDE
jgi:oxalate decarboxylase/phosphoglucose isomerase-like protein (cupin superfamily)